ncbi:Lrp/AsnC family transcriptional regulator [Rhizobium miluonense]|uniref:Lrp/AsnC family transcriptional regulator, leucine-responsive regulatory protein n=1 Tax=Rhizobium miluonense TaxID=411945 RepID=A0A1C3WZT1_9HYPH|nr:Lrp/AsnC family transcriptional regulator [Rhizobium miluonense]SCB45493.1 Lrp/AsnC family transcriptional regulator, leucine-responsive regulatory protein [Rhizobium miluonense]
MAVRQNKRPAAGSAGAHGDLDLIDRKILSVLRGDARLSTNDLSARVGLSPSPCWTRVKRLENSGAIDGYIALINHEAVGLPMTVFAEVTLDHHDDKVLADFSEALLKIPEVVEAFLVSGDYDYLIKVAVADTGHYERFLREKLYKIKGIRHSKTTFSLRAIKQSACVDPLLVQG